MIKDLCDTYYMNAAIIPIAAGETLLRAICLNVMLVFLFAHSDSSKARPSHYENPENPSALRALAKVLWAALAGTRLYRQQVSLLTFSEAYDLPLKPRRSWSSGCRCYHISDKQMNKITEPWSGGKRTLFLTPMLSHFCLMRESNRKKRDFAITPEYCIEKW